jgi:hypothetical protein
MPLFCWPSSGHPATRVIISLLLRKEKARNPAEKMNAINRNAPSTYPLAVDDASLERLRAPRCRITDARQHSLGVEAALDQVEAVAQQAPVELAVDGLVVEVEHLGLQNRARQEKGTAPSTTDKGSLGVCVFVRTEATGVEVWGWVLAWRKTSPTCSSPGHFRRAFHSHASLKTCPILSMPSASRTAAARGSESTPQALFEAFSRFFFL